MSAPHLHHSDKKLGCAGKIAVVALSLDTELLRLVGRFAFAVCTLCACRVELVEASPRSRE